jgi:hypothetical protein
VHRRFNCFEFEVHDFVAGHEAWPLMKQVKQINADKKLHDPAALVLICVHQRSSAAIIFVTSN